MSEQRLWQWLRKAQVHYGDDLHMCRVENLAGAGAADVEGCLKLYGEGLQFHIELKYARRPAKGGPLRFGSPLRHSQRDWAIARLRAGGRYSFLIGVSEARYLVPATRGVILEMMECDVNEAWCQEHDVLDGRPAFEAVWLAVNP